MAKQTELGKAFEYACAVAIVNHVEGRTPCMVNSNSDAWKTAQRHFESLDEETREKLILAAEAAARVISRLEPQIVWEVQAVPLMISIQTDAQGISGDVRDVVCIRNTNKWQIGLSCKHNHHAVKHSRLSSTIDFGKEWLGIPCSKDYFDKITPLFGELREIRDDSREAGTPALWENIPDKAEKYYVPVLQAFLDELNRLAASDNEVPAKMINYLLGRNDFYKVITDDQHKTTRVEAINLAGTLNRASGNNKPIVNVPPLKLPTRFFYTGFKKNSNNTVEVVCDEGWTISMRLHNASSKVEPSLKFDVQLVSLPSSIYAQVEPWKTKEEIANERISAYITGIFGEDNK